MTPREPYAEEIWRIRLMRSRRKRRKSGRRKRRKSGRRRK
jgi:hypothetical protein